MSNEHLIELDLRGHGGRPSESQKAIIDQLLTLLRDTLVDTASTASDKLTLGIDELRASLAAGKDAAVVVAVGAKCVTACQEAVSRLGSERLERQQQVRALLELMREAL